VACLPSERSSFWIGHFNQRTIIMRTITSAILVAASIALSSTAFAAGESSPQPSNQTPTTSPKALKCKKNEVVKVVKKNGKDIKVCVKPQAGVLPDEDLYQQARLLAKAGEYEWALTVLASIENQQDPRVLNYTGYSHRKAGRLETGIAFYRKALAINPDFVLAREYLGEGYVAAGRVDLAKVELAEIEKRCGVTCEEYKDLNEAIQTAVN
jgi:tetratricopeptide (TPR) repeat protein